MKTLLTCLLVLAVAGAAQAQTGVYFSEYLEGASNNKAVEIYNGTGEPVDLGGLELRLYSNGRPLADGPTASHAFSGTVADGVERVGGVDAALVALDRPQRRAGVKPAATGSSTFSWASRPAP